MTEPFVSAEVAAAHLDISPRRLLDLARSGDLPSYPLALGRKRHEWRFRLSELEHCLKEKRANSSVPSNSRSKVSGP